MQTIVVPEEIKAAIELLTDSGFGIVDPAATWWNKNVGVWSPEKPFASLGELRGPLFALKKVTDG
jgi:hypothetical protein